MFLCLLIYSYDYSWAQSSFNTSSLELKKTLNQGHRLSAEVSATSHANQLEVGYQYKQPSEKIDFRFGTYGKSSYNYLAVPEAFKDFTSSFLDNTITTTLSAGRKISYQNSLDHIFNLGLVHPFYTSDYLRYTQQGLIGLHTETEVSESSAFKVGISYYPFFLPNQGPLLKEENGDIVGPTPWMTQSPKYLISNNQSSRIKYDIQDNDYSEIINKAGYGVYLKADLPSSWQFQMAYAYTPINEVVLGRTINTDLNLNSHVRVYPVVRYSRKINSDLRYQKDNTQFFISYLSDQPENELEKNGGTVQYLSAINGIGTGISLHLENLAGREAFLSVSYAYFYDGEIKDVDDDGVVNSFTLIRRRLLFQKPLKVQAEVDAFYFKTKPVIMQVAWTYDQSQSGSLLSVNAKHQLYKQLTLSLGFDLLGVTEVTESNTDAFLTQHRSDDQWTGGLQYVF